MALISDDTILEVKRSTDIVDVVSSFFPLRRKGTNLWACCPFHEEKTASFTVHPEKQIWKCFGCTKAGDAIGFVMDYLKVDYPESIRFLAEKAGIQVRYKDDGGGQGPPREELQRVVSWAAQLFRGLLRTSPEAEPARKFLEKRGVSEESAETFGLGYSMDAWDHLMRKAKAAGIHERVLIAAGLVTQKDGGGIYDRFRGRVMFPIVDPMGRTIAFGARTLKVADDQVKFLNSPESAIFSKGRGFYGFHLAKDTWATTKTAYIVEGYLDVVVPHQAGVKGLVATLGTSLTRDHLKFLRRHVQKVVLVFDADPAGQRANERGLDMLLSENMDISVAELPAGKDPDDVVREGGADALRTCLDRPKEVFDFLMDALTARHGGDTPSSRARIVEDVIERLVQMPNEIKREMLVKQVAARFGIDERTLRTRLAKPEERPVEPPRKDVSPEEEAARELLAIMVADPSQAMRVRWNVPSERFPTEALRKVAATAYGLIDRKGEVHGNDLVALLDDRQAMETAADVVSIEVDVREADGRVRAAMATLEKAAHEAGLFGGTP